jgi:hypothetical protein
MKKIVLATAAIATLILSALTASAQTQSRDDILKELQTKRAELSTLEKRFLSPAEEDRAAYAEFLRQPNTGLIRLLPRGKYDPDIQRDKPKTVTIRGGGAYYSFARLTHEYGYGSDIELDQDTLTSGFAGADYGMLVSLGDVPLESISLETPAAQVLSQHKPPTEEPLARIEQRRSSDGTTIEGVTYKRTLPLRVNSTYLVRSINYSDSDVLVAFRVVRVDTDGSAIILWKSLGIVPDTATHS